MATQRVQRDFEEMQQWNAEYEKIREEESRKPLWMKLIYSKSYQGIAMKHFLVALFMLMIGGSFALMLRAQSGITNTGIPYVVPPVFYFQDMTDHVMAMIFGVVFDISFGLGFYFVPLLTGTRVVKYPKLANLGLWTASTGIIMMLAGGYQNQYLFVFQNPLMPATNWFIGYGAMVVGEWMVMTSIIATSFNWRSHGRLMPLGVALLVMDMIQMALGNISVFAAVIWSLVSPMGQLGIFLSGIPNAEVWKALFWYADHPLVYFGPYALMGAVAAILPVYARRPLFSYRLFRWMVPVLFVLGMSVYVHHIATDPVPLILRDVFAQTSTAIIAIPFAAVWMIELITLGDPRKLKWDVPLMFIYASIIWNIIGGIHAEPVQPSPATDPTVHNTLWIPSHIHIMMAAFTVGGFFGVLYIVLPHILNRAWYSNRLAQIHFWGWNIGMGMLIAAFNNAGFFGAIRREVAWPIIYQIYYQFAALGGWIAGFAAIAFIVNLGLTAFKGKRIQYEGYPRWLRRSLAMERYGMRQEGYSEDSLPMLPIDQPSNGS
ncbi:MAG: cbb3-type cytochrome c oxidase subunit I [Candidatus Marsarchaeota archaeon]|nr:cbb3-type cytochrome c oxidase subunit I [Candidatus Marsarchaeota archaeon]